MLQFWKKYVDTFKNLITSGWKVYRNSKSTVDYYVYPYTSLPTKFRMGVASEINNVACDSSRLYGSARAIAYDCRIFYNSEQCVERKWA